MLPDKLRMELFDRLSIQTMRYVKSIPRKDAKGLVKEVYDMIKEDFFINGSLTSHSKVPELLAGVWTGGRETMLVDDQLDRTTKEAMTAIVSQYNDCAYCGDMLIGLVHSGEKHDEASRIFSEAEEDIGDQALKEKLLWVKEAVKGGDKSLPEVFDEKTLPEVIGSILAISHINRFSHIVMDGSPVNPLFGSQKVKGLSLRMFGHELKSTKLHPLIADRTAHLLPQVSTPQDMEWAEGNPRIARALARWAGAIERESKKIASNKVREFVRANLEKWDGTPMPLSRSWVEKETEGLAGEDRDVAKFALIVAKSATQMDEGLVNKILGEENDEEKLIRTLAWSSFLGARRVAAIVAQRARSVVYV
jgi:hypothetical protein